MHSLNNRGVHSENLRIFSNCDPSTMDYRQKMVVPSSQKLKHEDDDDDEDLEALRLAALNSLRAKHTLHPPQQPAVLPHQAKPRLGYPPCPAYNHQRQTKRRFYQNRPRRQNGNTYYPSRVNQNLIEIIPVEEEETTGSDITHTDFKAAKTDIQEDERGDSKFYRYEDNPSGSDEEDVKESIGTSTLISASVESDSVENTRCEESGEERKIHTEICESPCEAVASEDIYEKIAQDKTGEKEADEEEEEEDDKEEGDGVEEEEEEEEDDDDREGDEKAANDDDDDVLLMADLEEEDSLERLMDEMEREMNVDKFDEVKEKVSVKKESKESGKSNEMAKVRNRKARIDRKTERNGVTVGQISDSSTNLMPKNERRSVSPRATTRTSQKRRSLSPKRRLRKKSPRRSPRRSPSRLSKKSSFREPPRMKSPRKLSPPSSRFSPRLRSPKLSPRGRSPGNRSPLLRRSPPRKLSPRGRSPSNRSPPLRRSPPPRKLSPRGRSPLSRSPRNRRSRSPRLISHSRSPPSRLLRSPKRSNRSRSPRIVRSRSPRAPTPRSKSPRISPSGTNSPRRLIASPRPRSPKLSTPERRRGSPTRLRSPLRSSPHRSPWSSPRNSPRLSPRRRKPSPKESTRKQRQRSITPDEMPSLAHKRETSPLRKNTPSSPDIARSKAKQKDSVAPSTGSKDNIDLTNDPILEARRRKFESTKLIDPIHDNKKIKLGKKEPASKIHGNSTEEIAPSMESSKIRKSKKVIEEDYDDMPETDLCQSDDYVFEVVEDVVSDESSAANTVATCIEMVPVKVEKERSKKKKKRDKELYQVGKLKSELPLSERIGKEKKCKKRRERAPSTVEDSPEQETAVEDLAIDDEEADLRTELSRRRAERLNRTVPIQSARLLQSAFKGVVNEVAKTNAKVIQRHAAQGDEKKNNKKEVRRVTVLHRTVTEIPDSDDEAAVDSKVPIRFRLGINKPTQENSRESKATRKSSKKGRKVKHKNNMSLTDQDRQN